LPREFIAQHQRARIIAALAEETVEKGYRAVTVADIVRRAGIARNTFYENFSSKEDCFLAASEFAVKEALRRVVDAASKVDTWPARVNSGLAAFLHYVATEPALARTCIVEALSAGEAAQRRHEQSLQAADVVVERRELHQTRLDGLPRVERVDEEATATVGGDDEAAVAAGGEPVAMTGRDCQTALGVEHELGYAAKDDRARAVAAAAMTVPRFPVPPARHLTALRSLPK